jgi:hypothetical protein
MARLHGRVLLPWARDAVDLAGETDARGRYAYPVVVVLVPRQATKTTTAFDIAMGRCLAHRDYRAAYTAQTGQIASERFRERLADLARTHLSARVKTRMSAGSERFTFAQGSYLKAFPPMEGSLRGSALDLVIVDEAQEISGELGTKLDHAILPTFTTRPRRQLILLGTAPAQPGTYLERYADLARAGTPGVALIDYGAVDGDDIADPDTWRRRHPGLAGGITDEAYLQSMLDMDAAGFAREHLNVWPRGRVAAVIDPAQWAAAADPDQAKPPAGTAAFAVDVTPDRSEAVIAAAWLDDGSMRWAVLWSGAPHRCRAAVDALRGTWRPRGVWYDPFSGGSLARDAGGLWQPIKSSELAIACASVLDRLAAGTLRHRPDPQLDDAAVIAVTRTWGDAGFAWGRRGSSGSIAPLVACTLAGHGAETGNVRPSITTRRKPDPDNLT